MVRYLNTHLLLENEAEFDKMFYYDERFGECYRSKSGLDKLHQKEKPTEYPCYLILKSYYSENNFEWCIRPIDEFVELLQQEKKYLNKLLKKVGNRK